MELLTDPFDKHIVGLQFMLNHIKILCNNDEVVYQYLICWVAQMIQYPDVKTIMPCFISKEGSGKGSFITLLSKMLGANKILESTNPSRDVWGNFNGLMEGAFLVVLNELSKNEFVANMGKFKALVTDPTIVINHKGINAITVNSYHRILGATNNEDGMPTTHGDRRNAIIRCSDEKKGDTVYFDQLFAYLDNINVIRTCYDYFKSIPDMDKFNQISLPQTEF